MLAVLIQRSNHLQQVFLFIFSRKYFSTEGFPSVIVPVLSVIRTLTCSCFLRLQHFFINTPDWAPLPTPTITDIGVANPNAQGQAIIKTAIAFMNP
jgi:hypothetical protein